MDKKLVEDTFKTAYTYSFELTKGIDLLTNQIKADDLGYIETLYLLINGLEWYLSAVEKTSIIQKEKLDLETINHHLKSINDEILANNILYVRDIFKYEIKENIKKWQKANKAIHLKDES